MLTEARILCVEDEPELLDDLTMELRDSGFIVEDACDGQEGLERLINSDFDLVVCDIKLPKLDGLSMMREVARLREYHASPPFILLTAFDDPDVRMDAATAGAAEYFVKPVDYNNLIANIHFLLGFRSTQYE